MSTLQYHSALNSKLWDVGQLDPEVSRALMRIISAWVEHARIPPDSIQDYWVTGGNVNFNYTPESDIDVHAIVDQQRLAAGLGISKPEILAAYLKDEKTLWTLQHADIRVRGYPVEPYAQASDEPVPEGQGAWSLMHGAWIREPSALSSDPTANPQIYKKADQLEHEITRLLNGRASTASLGAMKDRLNEMRSAGLKVGGEFALPNLVFKELRNRGLLDQLKSTKRSEEDQSLSLR